MAQWHSLTNTNINGLGQACEMSIANACANTFADGQVLLSTMSTMNYR